MCGIFFSCSQYKPSSLPNVDYLNRRGPDCSNTVFSELRRQLFNPVNDCPLNTIYLTFHASVLSLRGDETIQQPLKDPAKGSILCWNGEAWKIDDFPITGNDAKVMFEHLITAAEPCMVDRENLPCSEGKTLQNIVSVLNNFSGPASFVFYDAQNQRIFYGRDSLGRRSLLQKRGSDGSLLISSVREFLDPDSWDEIEAGKIYMLNFSDHHDVGRGIIQTQPAVKELLPSKLNKETSNISAFVLSPGVPSIDTLSQKLFSSLSHRVLNVPEPPGSSKNPPRIAVLFSGGLDCALLARLIHETLPQSYEIDLLNVAFENPRLMRALKVDESQISSFKPSAYAICPDRITGVSSHSELLQVCPGRVWRFVSIDIAYSETLTHRREIINLMHPHRSQMDLSIACAFYFAARGIGTVLDSKTGERCSYTTPARVLLSGLGADELFAGYTRHATAFRRNGYQGLVDELELDYNRLGNRNLGRDDRIISHWGKEVRYPYLDEDLVNWALGLPIWEKCGFGQTPPTENDAIQIALKDLESKKLLRLLAWSLGMKSAAVEKKRAIQFGARTANMEDRRVKGTQVLS